MQRERDYILYRKPDPGANQLQGLPTQNANTNMNNANLKPTPFAQLAHKENGDKIGMIEGRLSSLWEPEYKTKDGKDLQYPKQNGVLKDAEGNEHKVCFSNPKVFQDMSHKGKTIRISSYFGEKGQSGLQMKEETYTSRSGPNAGKEVTKRMIWVTATANIEVLGNNGHSVNPAEPNQPTRTTQSTDNGNTVGTTQPARPMSQSYDQDPTDQFAHITFGARVAEWVRGLTIVCESTGHNPKDVLGGLGHDKLAELTTCIFMSCRGKYGAYRPAPFAPNAAMEKAKANMEEQLARAEAAGKDDGGTDSPTPSTSGSTWRDYVDRGTKLGGLDETVLLNRIKWAVDNREKQVSPAAAQLRTVLLEAEEDLRAEYRDSATGQLEALGFGSTFDEDQLNELCQERYGADFSELTTPQYHELSGSAEEDAKAMKAAYDAKHVPPAKKATTKKATPQAEPDDMPA